MFLQVLVAFLAIIGISHSAASRSDINTHLFESMLPVFRDEETRALMSNPLQVIGGDSVRKAEAALERIHELVEKKVLSSDQAKSLIRALARAERAKVLLKTVQQAKANTKSTKSI